MTKNEHLGLFFYRFSAHANLASASMYFLSAFFVGVSVCLNGFEGFVRSDGSSDRMRDAVDRMVDVVLTDMASFSDWVSILGRHEFVMFDVVSRFEAGVAACTSRWSETLTA